MYTEGVNSFSGCNYAKLSTPRNEHAILAQTKIFGQLSNSRSEIGFCPIHPPKEPKLNRRLSGPSIGRMSYPIVEAINKVAILVRKVG